MGFYFADTGSDAIKRLQFLRSREAMVVLDAWFVLVEERTSSLGGSCLPDRPVGGLPPPAPAAAATHLGGLGGGAPQRAKQRRTHPKWPKRQPDASRLCARGHGSEWP